MNDKQKPFFLAGNFAPWMSEDRVDNLKVIKGTIPKELNGCLYRNGPNPQFPDPDQHWFLGDGMIHAIKIENGKVHYQNRWVRTERFNAERKAGRSLFGRLWAPKKNPQTEGIKRNTANTHIVSHAGHLLALQETTPAIELNHSNLETIGDFSFDEQTPTLSAHPHTLHITQDFCCHTYKPFSNEILYYRINSKGHVAEKEKISAPFSSFMHDFMISQKYIIFPVMPLTFDQERAQKGVGPIAWDSDKGNYFGIMPHGGNESDLIWFELEPFYVYHFMNAYDDKDCLIVDGMKSKQPSLFPDVQGNNASREDSNTYLTRWIFNLKTRTIKEVQLSKTAAEFPRIDERFVGLPYQHGFANALVNADADIEFFNSIIHYDFQSGSETIRCFGENKPSEPVFIPQSKYGGEGEGYLLTVIYNAKSETSELWILDSMHIDQDPVAIVEMPHRIPYGFHGSWVS